MRKDDPSSRRPRRRKASAEPPLELGPGGRIAAPRKARPPQPPPFLDQDFGLALCLLPALKGKKLPDA